MSSFLYGLARSAFRRRGVFLLVWIAAAVLIGGFAGVASDKFEENFSLPGTESQTALDTLKRTFPQSVGTSAQVVVVAPDGKTVRDAAIEQAITESGKRFEQIDQVDGVTLPYDEHVKNLISDDGSAAIMMVRLDAGQGQIEDATYTAMEAETAALQQAIPGSTTSIGGDAYNDNRPGLSIVEGLGVVIALVVLLITLGSLRAAGMPLLTALLGVGITMALIFAATGFTTVSSTTPLLALMLGLAVGIDYALFIVSRHRDQLAAGLEPEESAARAVATAGSAVIFAGLTVMVALAGLAVAGIPFLTTMGVAAAVGVAVAVLIAITLLPALLGFAGAKLTPKKARKKAPADTEDSVLGLVHEAAEDERPLRQAQGTAGERATSSEERALSLSKGEDAPPTKPRRLGWQRRWVAIVTKVPALTIAVVVLGLGAMAIPAKDLQLALPSNRTADPGSHGRVTYDLIDEHFGVGYNGPLVVSARIVTSNDPLGVMDGIADDIKKLPGVASVPLATPNEDATMGIVQVVPTTGPDDPATKDLVKRIRALEPHWQQEYGVPTAVTGFTAVAIDISDRLGAALIPFGILVVGISLLLLTMVFRSIAVPIKATIGYLLSVGAAFGATAMVFEYGWGSSFFNVAQTGPVISFLPILLMGILFGLAMDYELFLVSRIREEYVHGDDARSAISDGFAASARVVVAAAIIMFSVFAAFVPEGEGPIKTIAFGLAIGVFVDAFIVRMTFVPAVLALLGRSAWWLPRWLDKILPTFDVEGEGLAHQLALRDWPSPDDDHLVLSDGLRLAGTDRDLALAVRPGEVLVVDGQVNSGKSALLLTLAGRMKLRGAHGDRARIKIAGLVLPQQSSAVRRSTAMIDCARIDGLRTELPAIQRRKPSVIFVDHADVLQRGEDTAALAELIDRTVADGRCVVLAARDRALIEDRINRPYRYLTLGPVPDLADARL
ncbi:MMPL family transporter [Microlunatus ginsengisoli]|uniref:MMPL family transporter n=1 Tax=Microlunatus ginsengisoli TaxID=363863 RepID=A0ABP7A0I3_9ACTN